MKLFFQNKKTRIIFLVFMITLFIVFFRSDLSSITGASRKVLRPGVVKKMDLIQRVTIAGIVIPKRKTVIMAPYNGYIKNLYVKMGEQVKKGDPIVSVVQSLQSTDTVYPLRAPFPGKVVQVEKSEGEYVKEGDIKDFIVRIDDLSSLNVLANVSEMDMVKIKLSQEATLKISGIMNHSYHGKLIDLSLAAKEKEQWGRSQVEFVVKVEISDPDDLIKPGMSSIMDIITNRKDRVLVLGHEFIEFKEDKYFVTMKDGSHREIEVGLQNEENFEIIKGIREGEEVKQIDFLSLNE